MDDQLKTTDPLIAELTQLRERVAELETAHAAHQRAEAESEAALHETRLRHVTDNMLDVVGLTDRQGVYQYVSPSIKAVAGYEPTDIVGRSLLEHIHPDDRFHLIRISVRALRTGQTGRMELRYQHVNGHYVMLEAVGTPARDNAGRIIGGVMSARDITARKRAETALRDSEGLLRRAESVARVGNWELHLTDGTIRASTGARLIYGLQGDEWSIADVQALPLPEYRQMLDAALAALIERQSPYDLEFRICRPTDGELRDIHSIAEYDPVSRTVFGVISDITEYRQTEQAEHDQRALADSLREVAILLNSTLDYSTVLDQMLLSIGRVVPHTTANVMVVDEAAGVARVIRARGYGDQGFGLAEQVLRLSLPLTVRNLRTMYDTRQPSIMNDTRNSPDWVVTPETAWTRSYLGAPIVLRDRLLGFINLDSDQPNFFTDEHAQRLMAFAAQAAAAIENARLFEAERDARQLAESLRDTATALNSSLDPDAVLDQILINVERVVLNEGANIMLINGDTAQVSRVRGRCSVESIGVESHIVSATYNLRTMRATGEPCIIDLTRDNPLWNVLPGHEWIASYAGAPIRIHGEVLGVLGLYSAQPGYFSAGQVARLRVFADQVALAVHNAQLHARMQLYAEELEERVLQRTRELTASNEQLAAANTRLTQLDQLKDQFISRISHELRTPLTNIKIYLELLETGKAEKRAKYLATLNTNTDRLHELIEDLLEVSQLDMAHATLSLRPFDLNHVATDLFNDKAPAARERDLTLTAELQSELPAAHGESSLTFQAAERLIANALAYTPRGGRVLLKTARQHRADGEWVTLTVQDTGPGISDKDLPHLFERFYRGKAAGDYTIPGTGLGLSICQAAIEKMGGEITVENAPATDGGGAAFTIWLPAAK
jgi:PAS domain S-box-containing protein